MGEPVEERRFVGHVTLARFSRATDVRKLVARHASTLFGQGILREVVLYRSPAHGEPGGYERVATFPLKAATS
jgi:2'-5' RNA ligase